ncbi:hypothetical protein D6089_09635 [Vibrio vulnificus]|uniref:hypothetical protein n=1 Tax=Vibrio TaxID=662 RepID=UPI0018C336E9|nr:MULTISPECIES: hypothetical protein [Vibrio]EGQ9310779.1 hypothetical protein [Vibrio vulnificus]EGR1512132.1 hypothetical protein [Vibrio vulnificus]EIY8041231.1 hypothetical protein [Vibrio vulnificus]MBG0760922.1 hypothetical protein [Vibrio cidicii]MBH9740105.1 hypothetical protein [Vibrio navarrensis]
MQLQVGKTYHAHQPSGELDLGCEVVEFPEVNFTFKVLPKPTEVIAESIDVNGSTKERVKLPKHLAKPEWYWIQKDNGVTCWFNQKYRQITEIR